MLSYQTKYIENTKKIAAQSDFYGITASDFPAWFALQKQAAATIEKLRQENIALLSENLFPVLDDLHNADNETIALLEEFAETLLDWRTNLDCGVYLLIYDSLLSLYRVRGSRDGIIKCLYKVGMGHFYQNRTVEGIGRVHTASFFFENEMIFTCSGDTLENMTAVWREHVDSLRALSERNGGKQILFMEIGCRSARGCAMMPWDFSHRDFPYDEEEQARFYESCFRAMWNEPWFAGFFWWDWYTFLPSRSPETGFSIVGKKAEEVVKAWYALPRELSAGGESSAAGTPRHGRVTMA